LLQEQAEKKAREMVGMVHATSGLESQAIDQSQLELMVLEWID